jgi:hypothetical protein
LSLKKTTLIELAVYLKKDEYARKIFQRETGLHTSLVKELIPKEHRKNK